MSMKLSQLKWPQVLSLGTGCFLLLWGLAGSFVTGFDDFAGSAGGTLLGLRGNPLANVVHLVTGLAFVIVTPGVRRLAGIGVPLSVLYFLMFAIGEANDATTNLFDTNVASNVLHMLVGLASIGLVHGAAWMRRCDKLSASSA